MTALRPWWDVRAAWIVFWRVRSTVYRGDRRSPWWSLAGWRTTFRAWWMLGHGRRLVS